MCHEPPRDERKNIGSRHNLISRDHRFLHLLAKKLIRRQSWEEITGGHRKRWWREAENTK